MCIVFIKKTSNEHADHVFVCRNVQFFGDAGQLKVHRAFVVVVGLGGVGSHAAAMLLRSGVGKLRLIDFDQVRVMRQDVLLRFIYNSA